MHYRFWGLLDSCLAAHVSEDNEVILYSTTWCGYCAKTREYFAENHIQYTDLDAEHSERGRSDYKLLGGNGIPIVVINNEAPIHGYNPKKFSEVLNNTESSFNPDLGS